jgi:hypothetical protein
MDVYVLNRDYEVVYCIDNYISLIWTQRYAKRGDFELMVKASAEMVARLRKGFYLVRDEDVVGAFDSVMIIQNITIQTDVENGDNLIVSGYDLKDFVHRRVIKEQTIFTNKTIKQIVSSLLDDNIINAEAARVIPHFNFDDTSDVGSTETLTAQVTGDNLGDYIEELLDKYGYGYIVYLDDGEIYFRLVAGEDRSMEQSANTYVIFSESFDNLLSTNYVEEMRDYGNLAYVAGEGEGADRRIKSIGSGSGIDRYELFVDARDISSNDGAIGDTEYNEMLDARGSEALAEHSVTTTFDGNVNNTVNFVLGRDYYIGDIVQVVTDYGISLPARITEIIESDDINGSVMIPTFEYKGGMNE